MASPSLALPGVLFVGEDERSRLVAYLGPAAGWMTPKGVLGWSSEVSVVARDALTEQIRRDAKIVMPEEQIPPAKMPLARQAAMKSPLIAVSSRLTQKLVDAGIRVHTIGADRVTSSFYYIAEGGGEPMVRAEGDLIASAGAMLGAGADNAAIDRALDGLADRLLRALSKDRVGELALELAAALPRAAADGSGLSDVDLESFEKELAKLVGGSEKYTPFLQEIANKLTAATESKVDVPLYGDARKVSQAAGEITVGDQTIALAAFDRWIATGPLTEPKPAPAAQKSAPPPAAKPEPKPATKVEPKPEPKPAPKPAEAKPASATPKPAEAKPAPKPAEAKPAATTPKPAEAKPAEKKVEAKPAEAAPANIKPLAAPIAAEPAAKAAEPEAPKPEPAKAPEPAPEPAKAAEPAPAAKAPEPEPAKVEEPTKPITTKPVEVKSEEPTKPIETKPVEKKAEPAKAKTEEKPKTEAKKEPASKAIEPAKEAAPAKPEAKGGIPWLWILVVAAAVFAAYRLLVKH